MLNRDGELALVRIKDRFERVQLCWLRSENVILSHNSFRPACVKAIISKDEFIRRLTKMGLADEPGIFEEIDRDWDLAMQVAGILKSEMPGIGVLSERKSIRCFLSVCSHVDRLIRIEATNIRDGYARVADFTGDEQQFFEGAGRVHVSSTKYFVARSD